MTRLETGERELVPGEPRARRGRRPGPDPARRRGDRRRAGGGRDRPRSRARRGRGRRPGERDRRRPLVRLRPAAGRAARGGLREGPAERRRRRVREALSRPRRDGGRLASGAAVVRGDRETLLERALPPFRAAVEAGVRAVMTAHIRFPALADEPATLSPELLEPAPFRARVRGLVITDALEMRAISRTSGIAAGGVRALAAGADALCVGADHDGRRSRAPTAVVEAVREGTLAEQRVLEAAERVRETAAWASSPRPHHDRAAGAEAARRALRVEGDPALVGEPVVVELWPEPTIAAGEAHHGLGELLGAETIRVRREIAAAAREHPATRRRPARRPPPPVAARARRTRLGRGGDGPARMAAPGGASLRGHVRRRPGKPPGRGRAPSGG